ncbi:hypothetical protein [Vagococcus fluvialis]|uniref:Uncharacterized protein n=1 Tax=Vagococcus fluvialis TaxID=2738 RepID=A0A7X6D9E5_9ENTE|nr:hypothetical protein [Vagococcus fluvialis]NKC67908.1 hypothetical protein [Vagococcus fluvialis]
MFRELKNVQVTQVSFVNKAVNKKKFFLTKLDNKQKKEAIIKLNAIKINRSYLKGW